MKFRIASIMWLMFAVACFFAGTKWHEFYGGSSTGSAWVVIGRSTTLSTPSGLPITDVKIGDPTIVNLNDVGLSNLDVTGKSIGATNLSVCDTEGARTEWLLTVRPTPTVFDRQDGSRVQVFGESTDPK